MLPKHAHYHIYDTLPYYIKDIPLLFSLFSICLIFNPTKYVDNNFIKRSRIRIYYYCCACYTYCYTYPFISNIGYNAFFFNNLYNNIFIIFYKLFYLINVKYLDKGLFEIYGPLGLYKINKFILLNSIMSFYNNITFTLFIKFFLLVIALYLLYIIDLFLINNTGIIIILIIIYTIENSFKNKNNNY